MIKKILPLLFLLFSTGAFAEPKIQKDINYFANLPEYLAWFASVEPTIPERDTRGLFLHAYNIVTEEMSVLLQQKAFHNPLWVRRLVLKFGSLYRNALECDESGNCPVSPAWQFAFSQNRENTKLASIQFFLSLSAHINRDMPIALAEIGTDFNSQLEKQDFETITQIYTRRMPDLIRVVQEYELCNIDALGKSIIETLMPLVWGHTRNEAWKWASKLALVQNEAEETIILKEIDDHVNRDNFWIDTFAPLPAKVICGAGAI